MTEPDRGMTHAEFVYDLLSGVVKPTDPATAIALAQVHATMHLAEVIDSWVPPREPDMPELPPPSREALAWLRP
jgi:hypothetical protein